VCDTHEPIVSQDVFDIVQRMVTSRRNKGKTGWDNIFSGLIKCADCGYAMTANSANRRKRRELIDCIVYSCNNYTQYGSGSCSAHSIEARDLYDVVLTDINAQAAAVMADDGTASVLLRRLARESERQSDGRDKERRRLSKRLAELDRLFAALYEDRAAGQIAPRNYEQMRLRYEAEQEDIAAKLDALDAELAAEGATAGKAADFAALVKDYEGIAELNAATLNALIERIDVEERVKAEDGTTTQRITIHYKFVGTLGDCEIDVPKRKVEMPARYCERCGAEYTPGSAKAKYCPECRKEVREEWAAQDVERKREKRHAYRVEHPLSESIYAPKTCASCGREFTPLSGNTKHCPECRPEARRLRQRTAASRKRELKVAEATAAEIGQPGE
jgi:predicted RNA-binding Zn-ribbon protein involved in translation (DUF1610 family)